MLYPSELQPLAGVGLILSCEFRSRRLCRSEKVHVPRQNVWLDLVRQALA